MELRNRGNAYELNLRFSTKFPSNVNLNDASESRAVSSMPV